MTVRNGSKLLTISPHYIMKTDVKMSKLFISFLLLLPSVKGQYFRKKVMCYDSGREETLQCGQNEVIDIRHSTIALVDIWSPCTDDRLVPVIEALQEPCKKSANLNGQPQGPELYKRCHGRRSCDLNYQIVPRDILITNCGPRARYPNMLMFNYTCVPAGASLPGSALLPLGPTRQVSGQQIELFSPYYPCNSPSGYYDVSCEVTPQRSVANSEVQFSINPKVVTFQRANNYCGDYLHFTRGGSTAPMDKFYCSETGAARFIMNGNVITFSTIHNLHVKYRANGGSQGGRFWLQIKAKEGGSEVSLDVSCSGQEQIGQPSPSCSPLIYATPPPTALPPTTLPPTTTIRTRPTTTLRQTTRPTTRPTTQPNVPPTNLPAANPAPSETTPGETANTTRGNQGGHDARMPTSSGVSDTILLAVLGAVLGLVLIFACIAVVLFCLIRKRQRSNSEGKQDKVVKQSDKNAKTGSLRRIKGLITKPSTNGHIPKPTNSVEGNSSAYDVKIPVAKVKPKGVKKMKNLVKNKINAPYRTEEDSIEVLPVEGNYKRKSNAKSIRGLVDYVKSKTVREPKMKTRKSLGLAKESIVVLHPFENTGKDNENTVSENTTGNSTANSVEDTCVIVSSPDGAGSAAVYSVPLKKAKLPTKSKSHYENWNDDNKNMKATGDYDNSAELRKNHSSNADNDQLQTDIAMNNTSSGDTNLYENLSPKAGSGTNVDKGQDDTRLSIILPDTYENLPNTRVSLA